MTTMTTLARRHVQLLVGCGHSSWPDAACRYQAIRWHVKGGTYLLVRDSHSLTAGPHSTSVGWMLYAGAVPDANA